MRALLRRPVAALLLVAAVLWAAPPSHGQGGATRRRRQSVGHYANVGANYFASLNQSHQLASNASLQAGNIDITVACWVQLYSKGAVRCFICKGNITAAASTEYSLEYNSATDRFTFLISDGTTVTTVADNTLGSPNIGQWYLVFGIYDSVADLAWCYTNTGAGTSAAQATGIQAAANIFRLGSDSTNTRPMDGIIDSAGYWKRALSAADRATLYNNGYGLAFIDLSSALKTSLVSWWDLDGNARDSFGTNTLAPVNGPTFVAGKR